MYYLRRTIYCNLTATGVETIETIHKIIRFTPTAGDSRCIIPHIHKIDATQGNFESVGWGFESLRVRWKNP